MALLHPVAPALTRKQIAEIAQQLPADPSVLARLNELLQDPNTELDQITAELRRDVTLSAKIVKLSNSPMFGVGRNISTPDEAVNRVGFSEILRLVGTATAGRLSEQTLQLYDIDAKLLRDNMLYGAIAAEALARPARMDPRVAYCAGLLRCVGLMILERAGRTLGYAAPVYSASQWPDYASWERSVFGISSTEVTGILLDEWNFPPEVSRAIRHHYVRTTEDYSHRLAVLLNVANGMAQFVSRSFQGENVLWKITPEKLQAVGLKEEDFESAIATTESSFDAAIAALGR